MTLEVSNVVTLPTKLWPDAKIGLLRLFRAVRRLSIHAAMVYGSVTGDQSDPNPSRS